MCEDENCQYKKDAQTLHALIQNMMTRKSIYDQDISMILDRHNQNEQRKAAEAKARGETPPEIAKAQKPKPSASRKKKKD